MLDLPSGDAILVDLPSQALYLKDALASGDDRALLPAFEAVARARGLTQLAADAGLDRRRLAEMVEAAVLMEVTGLKQIISGLVQRWETAAQDDTCKFSAKDSLESDET